VTCCEQGCLALHEDCHSHVMAGRDIFQELW
jgi:hypothetical protein